MHCLSGWNASAFAALAVYLGGEEVFDVLLSIAKQPAHTPMVFLDSELLNTCTHEAKVFVDQMSSTVTHQNDPRPPENRRIQQSEP